MRGRPRRTGRAGTTGALAPRWLRAALTAAGSLLLLAPPAHGSPRTTGPATDFSDPTLGESVTALVALAFLAGFAAMAVPLTLEMWASLRSHVRMLRGPRVAATVTDVVRHQGADTSDVTYAVTVEYTARNGSTVRDVQVRSPSRRRYQVGQQVHVRMAPGGRRDVELHPLLHAVGEAVFLPVVVVGGITCGVLALGGLALLVEGLF